MHCGGSCQLTKQILEQEKKQRENPDKKGILKVQVLSSRFTIVSSPQPIVACIERKYASCNAGIPVDQPSFFFHPPGA